MIKTTVICVAHKQLKDAATRCVFRRVDALKCFCRWAAPRALLRELTALPRLPSWIWGNGEMETERGERERGEETEFRGGFVIGSRGIDAPAKYRCRHGAYRRSLISVPASSAP